MRLNHAYLYVLSKLLVCSLACFFYTSQAIAFPATSATTTSGIKCGSTIACMAGSASQVCASIGWFRQPGSCSRRQDGSGGVCQTSGCTLTIPASCPNNSTILGNQCSCNSGYNERTDVFTQNTYCSLVPEAPWAGLLIGLVSPFIDPKPGAFETIKERAKLCVTSGKCKNLSLAGLLGVLAGAGLALSNNGTSLTTPEGTSVPHALNDNTRNLSGANTSNTGNTNVSTSHVDVGSGIYEQNNGLSVQRVDPAQSRVVNKNTQGFAFSEPMPDGRRRFVSGTPAQQIGRTSGGKQISKQVIQTAIYDPATGQWTEIFESTEYFTDDVNEQANPDQDPCALIACDPAPNPDPDPDPTPDPDPPPQQDCVDPADCASGVIDQELQTKNLEFDFDPESWGEGSCPADIPIDISVGQYGLSYQPYCDFATRLKPITLAISFIVAIYLLLGAKGND